MVQRNQYSLRRRLGISCTERILETGQVSIARAARFDTIEVAGISAFVVEADTAVEIKESLIDEIDRFSTRSAVLIRSAAVFEVHRAPRISLGCDRDLVDAIAGLNPSAIDVSRAVARSVAVRHTVESLVRVPRQLASCAKQRATGVRK